jgi:hypothetical protein
MSFEPPVFRGLFIVRRVPCPFSTRRTGSKTNPDGYGTCSTSESQGQFQTCDDRSLGQVQAAIRGRGYCPVFKDCSETFGGVQP